MTISVVITTYDRFAIARRCIERCLRQDTRADQIVVVDDGSSDGTAALLHDLFGSAIDLVVHERNRGINPARRSGVDGADGDWIIVLDSDWELLPHAITRFQELISTCPDDVSAIRARLELDDGQISPRFVPAGPVNYVDRVRWADEEGGLDSLPCVHRSVFDTVPYISDRRGTVEELYELDLAEHFNCLYVSDVLGRQHFDAENSYLRSVRPEVLIPQLLNDAPDLLWMTETTLSRHGETLREHGPRQYGLILQLAASKAFLTGDRRKGIRYAGRALRRDPRNVIVWTTALAGAIGKTPLAYLTLVFRRLRAAGS